MPDANPQLAPLQLQVVKTVTRGTVSVSSILTRLYFALCTDELYKVPNPLVELRVSSGGNVFRLIVAVFLVVSELFVLPKFVGDFDATIPALPDQPSMRIPHVIKRFLRRLEIVGMPEKLGTSILSEFLTASISVAEERGCASFKVILAEHRPLRAVFQLDGELRIFVLDQILPRIATVHAHETIEHEFQV